MALTRDQGESYDDFILRVSKNKKARLVKIADLEDNMDITRLENLMEEDHKRIKKYHNSWINLKKIE